MLRLGRRVAELELHIALAHLMRNFRVEYPAESPLGYIIKHTLVPDRRMDLKLMDY